MDLERKLGIVEVDENVVVHVLHVIPWCMSSLQVTAPCLSACCSTPLFLPPYADTRRAIPRLHGLPTPQPATLLLLLLLHRIQRPTQTISTPSPPNAPQTQENIPIKPSSSIHILPPRPLLFNIRSALGIPFPMLSLSHTHISRHTARAKNSQIGKGGKRTFVVPNPPKPIAAIAAASASSSPSSLAPSSASESGCAGRGRRYGSRSGERVGDREPNESPKKVSCCRW